MHKNIELESSISVYLFFYLNKVCGCLDFFVIPFKINGMTTSDVLVTHSLAPRMKVW